MATTQEEKSIRRRNLLVKKPFTKLSAVGSGGEEVPMSSNTGMKAVKRDNLMPVEITQSEMLRQLDPSAHLIYNKEYYPDIWREDENGRWYIEQVPRYAFAYQRIILTKQLTHLCGNDIVFELADDMDDEHSREILNSFMRGWNKKDMEIAWYQLARSVKSTGDGAIVGYLDKGKFGWKCLSFLNGDTLYPHYNRRTGNLELFAREYTSYDDDGETRRFIDVWDEKYFVCLMDNGEVNDNENDGEKKEKNSLSLPNDCLLKKFDIDGYVIEECEPHNFGFIPVAYHRSDEGACWAQSQEAIDNYEMAFSRLAQSNHDFGLPIMYVKGEGSEELTSADMSYASKVITLPTDGEAGFLNRQDASNAYNAELKMIEDQIYRQSFAVRTPELKSGDTPGVAIKMLYSDAVEKAINDAQLYQHAIHDIVEIFKFGYGVEAKMRLDFQNTEISFYIQPYIHINETERTTILATAVQNGFCSRQTAAEKFTLSTPQEWTRKLREEHDEEMRKLLLQEQTLEMQNEQNVDYQQQVSEIQTEQQVEVIKAQQETTENDDDESKKKVSVRKGSVATGRGRGRPNRTGIQWDSNRNAPGENNWRNWNLNH